MSTRPGRPPDSQPQHGPTAAGDARLAGEGAGRVPAGDIPACLTTDEEFVLMQVTGLGQDRRRPR